MIKGKKVTEREHEIALEAAKLIGKIRDYVAAYNGGDEALIPHDILNTTADEYASMMAAIAETSTMAKEVLDHYAELDRVLGMRTALSVTFQGVDDTRLIAVHVPASRSVEELVTQVASAVFIPIIGEISAREAQTVAAAGDIVVEFAKRIRAALDSGRNEAVAGAVTRVADGDVSAAMEEF